MWFIYIARCADNTLYMGETNDVDRRLAKHNEGGCVSTKERRPVVLAYSELLPNRAAALVRERQIKRWTRAKKEALIAREYALLKRL